MNKNRIIKYIKNEQLITGLHNYFQRKYKKMNNSDKNLYKEKIKNKLKKIIVKQNIEIPLTVEFNLFFLRNKNMKFSRNT